MAINKESIREKRIKSVLQVSYYREDVQEDIEGLSKKEIEKYYKDNGFDFMVAK